MTSDRARTVQASWHAHPKSTVAFTEALGPHAATITGVDPSTGRPALTILSLIPSIPPSAGASYAWTNASIVRGQKADASRGIKWQGWYSSNYNGNSTAPTLVYNGAIPKMGAVFGWLLIPQEDGSRGLPSASLQIEPKVGVGGAVTATVTIGGRQEQVILRLGVPPAPPPPCAAGSQWVCEDGGTCCCVPVPRQLACPKGQRVDMVLTGGDDGSCACDEYCATNWGNHVTTKRPQWTGATSAYGKHGSVLPCGTGVPVCACVQATHFCPQKVHLCKAGCDAVGSPAPKDYCVPDTRGHAPPT